MKALDKIIVSDNSYKSDDPYRIVDSNITVINLLRDERIDAKFFHPDARISYCVDYFLAQCKNGNFSQFVWNSKWEEELNAEITSGLKKMGAAKHLTFFLEQSEKVNALPQEILQDFFKNDYFGKNATRDLLNNDQFFQLDEDLTALNSQWLRNHPDLSVLPIADMFLALEKFIGRKINH